MAQVLKTRQAERDIEDIWFYIALEDLQAADRWLEGMSAQAQLVASQPRMGRVRPELGTEIRSFAAGRYVLFYRPLPDGIELVRVLHGARDLDALFGGDL
ncbi:type II toxin-antitoxin system RelE/ParE family toxin [Gloeobacter violaceus]|uniref:Gsr3505 protein n=1 Tax=Gloeobacter violaceus (strain ATCC 29082 / PCC 7421) TaxID=251221 RepID=Q7NFL9_GLOVI|nr:type II toxin-antitoxin system RelE/ParE family toxin [Gloeobacter violaceus]BAC91446.1 gsr3505 [Gloeobacter violaceus PCC 7421]